MIPVDREGIGSPEVYGNDRVFVYLRLESGAGCEAGRRRGGAGKGRAAGGADLGAGNLRHRAGIFPLGDRDGRCGIGDRHQCVQSAGRGSEQDRDAQVDRCEYEKTGSLPSESPVLQEAA